MGRGRAEGAVKEEACDNCLLVSVPSCLTCLKRADGGTVCEFCGDKCLVLDRGSLFSNFLDSVKWKWATEGHELLGVRGEKQRLRRAGPTLNGNFNYAVLDLGGSRSCSVAL